MPQQTNPIHAKLWHKEFWFMAIANLLLTMSVYILIPIMPIWLIQKEEFSHIESSIITGIFGIGLFICGMLCSYLIQRFRRNLVCIWTIILMIGSICLLSYSETQNDNLYRFWVILISRLLSGAFFGLAQMILFNTLIIDTSESFLRTEAGYCASWFSRFAISLGPMLGLILYTLYSFEACIMASCVCAIISIVLIKLVKFPFRAPEENVHIISLERFFLPHCTILFINVLATTTATGLLISQFFDSVSYGIIMIGFCLALLTQNIKKFIKFNYEATIGLISIGLATIIAIYSSYTHIIGPIFIGLGLGICGSYFLISFIKRCDHCQRGTAQSTFMLGWETGMILGFSAGHVSSHCISTSFTYILALLIIVSFLCHYITSFKHRKT